MKEQSFPIKKKLELRLFVILPLYIIIGFVVLMLYQFIFHDSKNPIIEWFYWRLDVIYFFYLCIGLMGIFCHYWRKPWNYLDEVIAATQTVYEQNSHTIELSEPLREVEQQMNQIKMSMLLSQKAVKEAEDRKNELVMYLAHDIRTPLTAVIGYLSLLDEAHDMPTEQKAKYVGIALDKAERLETLINELFEITRYHMETVQLKKISVDLYALLAQVIEEFYPSLSARGNSVNVSIEDNLNVTGDPEKLARVFNNLLKNAVAYSYPNTEISISSKRKGKNVVVIFKNHGQTIEEEQLSGIFEKFNRLDEARLSDTGGVGLGLSIAKEIINLHGGEIIAQSNNETVTFTITLPAVS
ncbi:MAG: HAMP domain-containing histidine kinase [Lachnobacterium sp.]|nr:HAMP domain-containing histidine kinase [Lachnobacterium sp.]